MKVVALSDAAKVTMGTAPPGSTYNTSGEGMPMIAGAGDYGAIHPEPKKWTTEPTRIAEPGDIIVCVRATIGDLNWADKQYCLGRGVAGVRPHPDQLDTRYVSHYIDTKKHELSKLGTGSTFLAIRRGDLEGFQIPLPPLAEQKRIAAILDAADALRAKRRESLEQLDTLIQSTFLEMFGDGKRNPNSWPTDTIGDLVSDARGGASLKPDDFTSTGFPVLHKGAIKPRGVVELDDGKKTCASAEYAESKPRSVVTKEFTVVTLRDLVPSGPSIGLAANLERAEFPEYLLAQGAYGFRLDQSRIMPDYFVALSNDVGFRTVLRRFAVGSTQIHIRNPIYQKIHVPLPPLDLQHRFAAIVESVEQQKAAHRAHLEELDILFAALQQRAFQGEL